MHRIAALCFALLFAVLPVQAQEAYPSHPITLIVPYAPGGGSDFLGRVLAEYAHLDEIHVGRAGNRIELVDGGHIDAVTRSGKGLMLVSGHFANWEIMPAGGRDH